MSDREHACPECGSNLFDVEGGCLECGFRPTASAPVRYGKPAHDVRKTAKRRGRAAANSDRPAPPVRRASTFELRPLQTSEGDQHVTTILRPMQVTHTKNVLTTVFCDPKGTPIVSQGMISRPEARGKPAQRIAESDGARLHDNKYASCPRCNTPVKFKNLPRHLRRAHGLEGRPARSASLKASPAPKKVAANPKKKHGRTAPSQKATSARKQSRGSGSSREAFRQSYYDSMDATRDYYKSFRENGRYGSHPVHDSFDDESGPD